MALRRIRKVCTLFSQKRFNVFIALLIGTTGYSQNVMQKFVQDSAAIYLAHAPEPKNKIIPKQYDDVIRIALLYFPELAKTNIEFQIKKNKAPLSARPLFVSVFKKATHRKYIITISNETKGLLRPIQFSNLSFNAQIGVIGHELSHIVEYDSKQSVYFIRLALKHLRKKRMDQFEYNTDKRCVEHKLGYQLLSWSTEVREKLNQKKWGGSNHPQRERYMNPDTIIKLMKTLPAYQNFH
jgi:hypothetical protein